MLVDWNDEGDRRGDHLGRGEEGDAVKVPGRNQVRELSSLSRGRRETGQRREAGERRRHYVC